MSLITNKPKDVYLTTSLDKINEYQVAKIRERGNTIDNGIYLELVEAYTKILCKLQELTPQAELRVSAVGEMAKTCEHYETNFAGPPPPAVDPLMTFPSPENSPELDLETFFYRFTYVSLPPLSSCLLH